MTARGLALFQTGNRASCRVDYRRRVPNLAWEADSETYLASAPLAMVVDLVGRPRSRRRRVYDVVEMDCRRAYVPDHARKKDVAQEVGIWIYLHIPDGLAVLRNHCVVVVVEAAVDS